MENQRVYELLHIQSLNCSCLGGEERLDADAGGRDSTRNSLEVGPWQGTGKKACVCNKGRDTGKAGKAYIWAGVHSHVWEPGLYFKIKEDEKITRILSSCASLHS